MKINGKHGAAESREPRRNQLLRILKQPLTSEKRPCDGCEERCGPHGSTSCACCCAPACQHAPEHLSSELGRYPIEPRILALVFALSSTGSCQPCWSCEGHLGPAGKLSKLPAVWFYANDLTVVDMLSRFLAGAQSRLKLSTRWHLEVAYGTDAMAFSCTPNSWTFTEKTTLRSLQHDADKLADALAEGLRCQAQREVLVG